MHSTNHDSALYRKIEIGSYSYALFPREDGAACSLLDKRDRLVATAYFGADRASPPTPGHEESEALQLHYPRAVLAEFLRLLRTEAPVFLFVRQEFGSHEAYVGTEREPVGEQEPEHSGRLFHGIRFADRFPGADDEERIAAAVQDVWASGGVGTVVVPSGMCPSANLPDTLLPEDKPGPQAIYLLDLRTDSRTPFGGIIDFAEARDASGGCATERVLRGRQNPGLVLDTTSDGSAGPPLAPVPNRMGSVVWRHSGSNVFQLVTDGPGTGSRDFQLNSYATGRYRNAMWMGLSDKYQPLWDLCNDSLMSKYRRSDSDDDQFPIVRVPEVNEPKKIGRVWNSENGIRIATTEEHSFVHGQVVTVRGVQGNTAANGAWEIAIDPEEREPDRTFTLVDSAGNGTYTGGGEVGSPIEVETQEEIRLRAGQVITIWTYEADNPKKLERSWAWRVAASGLGATTFALDNSMKGDYTDPEGVDDSEALLRSTVICQVNNFRAVLNVPAHDQTGEAVVLEGTLITDQEKMPTTMTRGVKLDEGSTDTAGIIKLEVAEESKHHGTIKLKFFRKWLCAPVPVISCILGPTRRPRLRFGSFAATIRSVTACGLEIDWRRDPQLPPPVTYGISYHCIGRR